MNKYFNFLIGGATSFLLQFFILFILHEYFGIYYITAASIAIGSGLIYGFYFQKLIVFKNKAKEETKKQFTFFLINGLVNYVLTIFIMFMLVEYLTFHPSIAQIISITILLFFNYFIYDIIFNNYDNRK